MPALRLCRREFDEINVALCVCVCVCACVCVFGLIPLPTQSYDVGSEQEIKQAAEVIEQQDP